MKLILLSVPRSDWSLFGQSFFLVIFCIVLIFLAFYATKWLSRAKIAGKLGGNIHVIEAASVGLNCVIQLVKVGNKYFLIGVSKEKVTFLAEIDEEELNFSDKTESPSFEKYIQKFMNKGKVETDETKKNEDEI